MDDDWGTPISGNLHTWKKGHRDSTEKNSKETDTIPMKCRYWPCLMLVIRFLSNVGNLITVKNGRSHTGLSHVPL